MRVNKIKIESIKKDEEINNRFNENIISKLNLKKAFYAL